jgi:ureidoglycolate dehydrogenase (NAD+)
VSSVRISAAGLEGLATDLLECAGVSAANAAIAAGVLVRTDMRGISTHGVRHLPGYLRQLRLGGADPTSEPVVEREGATTAVVDARSAMGMLGAIRATQIAIEKGRTNQVAVVVVHGSNHVGAVGHYALLCAEAGLIGVVATNAPPIMAVTGSRTKVIGNDPLAYGVPTGDSCPIVHDIAMSAVAGGKVTMAFERKQEVPLGWIVDSEGRQTQNPGDYVNGGALMPLGDHKGYGLAVLVEVLAGALSGAAMGGAVGNWFRSPDQPTNTGHVIVAIDPAAFVPVEQFFSRVAAFRDNVRNAPRAVGVQRIYLPGEIEHEREQLARREGLKLDAKIWSDLVAAATELGRDAAVPAVASA